MECSLATLTKISDKGSMEVVQPHLVKIGITILGLAEKEVVKSRARNIFSTLKEVMGLTTDELFKRETGAQVIMMRKECHNWTATSHRVLVFAALMTEAGTAVGYYPEVIVDIFQITLAGAEGTAANTDHELQLKMFIVLAKLLYDVDTTLDSKMNFGTFAMTVLRNIILPAFKWHAGRKASAVRTAASSCLWSFFEKSVVNKEILVTSVVFPHLLTAMNSLIEDESEKTRVFICKTYKRLFEQLGKAVTPKALIKISSCNYVRFLFQPGLFSHLTIFSLTVLVQRLEDTSNEVRSHCLRAIAASIHCLPEETSEDMTAELRKLFTSILLHMDDKDSEIRNGSKETLIQLGSRCPALLLEMAKNAAEKNTHKEPCEQLIMHLQSMDVK